MSVMKHLIQESLGDPGLGDLRIIVFVQIFKATSQICCFIMNKCVLLWSLTKGNYIHTEKVNCINDLIIDSLIFQANSSSPWTREAHVEHYLTLQGQSHHMC